MSRSTYSCYLFLTFFVVVISTTKLQALDQNRYTMPTHYSTLEAISNFIHIDSNSDGKTVRIQSNLPTVPPNSSMDLAYSKDTLLNQQKNTWVRTYLPTNYLNTPQRGRLPVILYAHGGGFIMLSAGSASSDFFCSRAATRLRAMVVSVEYRLAPQARLPAAYDDMMDALYWVRNGNDEWVRNYGDISKTVIMGESSGGNMAYTIGLRVSLLSNALSPLVIKGLVLIQPFFGGVQRTPSELKDDKPGPMALSQTTDVCWSLSLPIGANRDDPFCNPFTAHVSDQIQRVRALGWRVAVLGCDGDPLFDRQVQLARWLKRQGVDVRGSFKKGYYHGAFGADYVLSQKLFRFVQNVFSQ